MQLIWYMPQCNRSKKQKRDAFLPAKFSSAVSSFMDSENPNHNTNSYRHLYPIIMWHVFLCYNAGAISPWVVSRTLTPLLWIVSTCKLALDLVSVQTFKELIGGVFCPSIRSHALCMHSFHLFLSKFWNKWTFNSVFVKETYISLVWSAMNAT